MMNKSGQGGIADTLTHNEFDNFRTKQVVGDSTTKVVKFEQITTRKFIKSINRQLVILPQR